MLDFLVIGGGIAGLSLASRLVAHGKTCVLEAEAVPGYHSSGRSVAFAHFGLGDDVIRGLTAISLPHLLTPFDPDQSASGTRHPVLHIAREHELDALQALDAVHQKYAENFELLSPQQATEIVPILKQGLGGIHGALIHHDALKLDADILLQGHIRRLRASSGELVCNTRVNSIGRSGDGWEVSTSAGNYRASVIINAAGAWADAIARLAEVAPVSLEPRRRTVIGFAGPGGVDVSQWPFTKTVTDGFYFLPEGKGRLMASPMDQTPSEPCDAAPEELDIAVAADRIMQATALEIRRIEHSWAGLRSFVRDERPVIGFAPDAPGFFWLAGQGGFGLQTSPAVAMTAEALLTGTAWPTALTDFDIVPELFAPERLK